MKTGERKVYNPNNFNAVDSAIAFIVILAAFFVLELVAAAILKSYGSIENVDYYLFAVISSIVSQGVVLGVAILFSVVRKTPVFSGGGFTFRFDFVDILFGVLLALGLLFLLSGSHYTFVDDVYRSVYGLSYDEYSALVNEKISGNEGLALLYVLLLVPVLPCICEEALFRGVIMKGLKQFGSFAAVIISSVFFCFMHGNFSQIIIQFFIGLAIASAVCVTDNFAVGCAMHFANNFFSTLVTALNSAWATVAPGIDYLLDATQIFCGVAFVVIGGLYFTKKALAKYKRRIKGEGERPTNKDVARPALLAKSTPADVRDYDFSYVLRTDLPSDLYDGSYCFYDGKAKKINSKANKTSAFILLSLGGIISVVLLFLSL